MSGIARSAVVALGMVLVAGLVATAPLAAQSPAASLAPPSLELAAEMPINMGGFEPEISITHGAEHIAKLDLNDPADAATAADLEQLFERAGVAVEDMTSGYALVSQEDFFSFVVAVRLTGAKPESVLPAYLPILLADLQGAQTAESTLGGKDVLVITSEGADGDRVELYIYVVADTVWMVQGPLDVVGSVLEDLP